MIRENDVDRFGAFAYCYKCCKSYKERYGLSPHGMCLFAQYDPNRRVYRPLSKKKLRDAIPVPYEGHYVPLPNARLNLLATVTITE